MPCPLSESLLSGCGEPSCLWALLGQPQTTLQVTCLGGEGTQRWGHPCCPLNRLRHPHQKKQRCAGSLGSSSSGLWDPLPPLKVLDDVSQPWHHCSSTAQQGGCFVSSHSSCVGFILSLYIYIKLSLSCCHHACEFCCYARIAVSL